MSNNSMRMIRSFSLAFGAALLLPVMLSGAAAPGPIVNTFQSEHHSVTMERFDPKTTGSHAAVIVVHGAGGPQGDWRKGGLISALTDAGFIAFVPHYFEGSSGDWKPSGNADQLIAFIRTLNDAARFVAQQSGVQKDGIGLVGFSLGGYVVLGFGEEEGGHPPPQPSPKIKVVVEMYGGMPKFAGDRMTTMPPVLILHGDNDDTVPISNAYDLEQLLKKKSLPYEIKIYQQQGHGFSGAALEDANRRTVSFLLANLR